ncbi:MAG TPA: DUF5752 family protein [Verrucomicrobiae bacterium]|nr:DUF5752 family protein [Verrucomicrobiae bacterium]
MLERSEVPFEFFYCIELRQVLGLKAETEKELARLLRQVSLDSVYYHTYGLLLRHRYRAGAYGSDFATWAATQVRDRVLGERLAAVDPLRYNSLADLREAIVCVIDNHLESITVVPRVVYSEPFEFIESKIVGVPTGLEAYTLEEFMQALSETDDTTIYYHAIEARRRLKHTRTDFSAWLRDDLHLPVLAARVQALDPYAGGLERMRTHILAYCRQVLTLGRDL